MLMINAAATTAIAARLLGPSRLARAFPTWFDTSYFAEDLRRAGQRNRQQAVPA